MVLTLLAVPAAYNFPSILPSSYLPTSPEQVFLIRLLLSALSALFGTFITLLLVLRAYYNLSVKHQLKVTELLTNAANKRYFPKHPSLTAKADVANNQS